MLRGLLVGLMLLAVAPAMAQEVPQGMTGDPSYVHDMTRPGRPAMTVYVWGNVGLPGTWRVEEGTDVLPLLSTVRVLGAGATGASVSRQTHVRIYRNGGGHRTLAYEALLHDVLTTTRDAPVLQDQDVLEVETVERRRFGWRDAGTVVSTASTLVLLVLRLTE